MKYLIILITLIVVGCNYINAPELNFEELQELPELRTPINNLRISFHKDIDEEDYEELMDEVDKQFLEVVECYGLNLQESIDEINNFKHVIVEGTFKCDFHFGFCNGFFSNTFDLIIAGISAPLRDGTLPLLKHEWGHAFGEYELDHSNQTNLNEECLVYLREDTRGSIYN